MDLASFEARARRIVDAIPLAHAKAQAYLAESAFGDLVEASPVRTGSYRASHTIGVGAGKTENFLFEHPSRPVPDERPPARETPIEAPDSGAVSAALEGIAPFQRIVLANAIYYAPFLEYGTGASSPRLIFDRARENARGRVEAAKLVFLRELGE